METLEGHVITFPARSVRYVRDWVNGNTVNAGNHWTEIQVWGRADVSHIGNYFEWVGNGTSGSTQTMLSYYYAGDQRVAMRGGKWTNPDTHGLIYLLGDHLGSASQAVDPIIDTFDSLPNVLTELRYTPWGKTRQTVGEMATDYRFTGQRWESGLGLYHYASRWYDPSIMQFQSPDTLIPDPYHPLDWNRYSYARQNPLRYTDPTGHRAVDGERSGGLSLEEILKRFYKFNLEGEWARREVIDMYAAVQAIVRWFEKGGGDRSTFTDYFEGTTIKHGHFPGKPGNSFVIGRTIRLSEGWDAGVFVHEMGHVLDNTVGGYTASLFGGGPSDVFALEIGGELCFPRFMGAIGANANAFVMGMMGLGSTVTSGYNPGDGSNLGESYYGLLGPSEDFAESFRRTLLDPTFISISSRRVEWMDQFSVSLVAYAQFSWP